MDRHSLTHRFQRCIAVGLLLVGGALVSARAAEYVLPDTGDALFGEVLRIETRFEDTLIQLARQYSLGYEELLRVNPGVDPWLPGEGTTILIPGQ